MKPSKHIKKRTPLSWSKIKHKILSKILDIISFFLFFFFFSYESESTPFGKVIRQINGIERRDNLQWYIYKVDPETEQEQKLTLGLENIKYEDGDTYHMKYDL